MQRRAADAVNARTFIAIRWERDTIREANARLSALIAEVDDEAMRETLIEATTTIAAAQMAVTDGVWKAESALVKRVGRL